MERMAQASRDLTSLADVSPAVAQLMLDAGFRTIEEVSLASLEDLTAIDGIDEETAITIHDSAEIGLERQIAEAEARAVEEAKARAVAEAEAEAAAAAEAEAETSLNGDDVVMEQEAVLGDESTSEQTT
jgi:transcription termination factor NusA